MQKQRKTREEVIQDQKDQEEPFLTRSQRNDTMEELGIQLHHTLELYPHLSESGDALACLLDETKSGVLHLHVCNILRVDRQHQRFLRMLVREFLPHRQNL